MLLFVMTIAQNAVAQKMPTLAPNLLTLPNKSYEINFIWQGDSVSSSWEPHAALLIPVKIKGCKKQFYMQFDSGSPSTIFYKSQWQQINDRFPNTLTLKDTATSLSDVDFLVGKMQVYASSIKLISYQSKAIDWKNKNGMEIIGTIGTDFIENRVIAINYPAKTFFTGANTPKKWMNTQMSDFMFPNRSVLLPVMIKGKNKILYFDSGSSAYEFLTDKKTTELLAIPGATAIQKNTRSWDRTLTSFSIPTADSIQIGTQKLPINYATYIEGTSQSQIDQMMKMGMSGMTGNKLFIHSTLLLDTKNKKFGVFIEKR